MAVWKHTQPLIHTDTKKSQIVLKRQENFKDTQTFFDFNKYRNLNLNAKDVNLLSSVATCSFVHK